VLLGVRITAEDMVAPGSVEIDFYVVLVGVKGLGLSVAEIVLSARTSRRGVERGTKQRLRHWINRRRDDVVEEWCPGRGQTRGIIELVRSISNSLDRNRVVAEARREPGCANITEVASAFRSGEKAQLFGSRGVVETLPLVIKEKEQLVLDDGTANGAAKHVPAQFVALRIVESVFPGVRIQLVIAEILPDVAVETVGA